MDIQRAIEWQKAFKKTYNGMPEEVIEACNTAIKALEKQMPEKILEDKKSHEKFDLLKCPNCEYIFHAYIKKEFRKKLIFNPKFCLYCGQALDWSEGESED